MDRLALEPKSYFLATVHRAENTDDPDRLQAILAAFRQFDRPILLPLHPRTRKTLGHGLARGRRTGCELSTPFLTWTCWCWRRTRG